MRRGENRRMNKMNKLDKKYQLITTGGDVLFIGKKCSKNYIDRSAGFCGDFAECMTAAFRAGFDIGKSTDKDFVKQNFDAMKKAAKFID